VRDLPAKSRKWKETFRNGKAILRDEQVYISGGQKMNTVYHQNTVLENFATPLYKRRHPEGSRLLPERNKYLEE
jgi:hypothetical protein